MSTNASASATASSGSGMPKSDYQKWPKNRYMRRISFERPPYGGVDEYRPTMLSLAKVFNVPSASLTVSSASASAAASEFSGSWASVNGWARAYAVNTYSWGSPRGSLGGGHGPP